MNTRIDPAAVQWDEIDPSAIQWDDTPVVQAQQSLADQARPAVPNAPQPRETTLGEFAGGSVLDLAAGFMRAPKVVPDLMQAIGGDSVVAELGRTGSDFFQRGIDAAEYFKPDAYKAEQATPIVVRDESGNLVGLQAPSAEGVVGTLLQSAPQIPQMIAGGGWAAGGLRALGLAPKVAAPLGFGVSNAANVAPMQYVDTLNTALEQGSAMPEAIDQAQTAGGLTALLSGLTGTAGAKFAGMLGETSRSLPRALVKGFAADAPFEGIEEAGQAVIDPFARGEQIDPLNALEAGLQGTVAGGLPGAALAGISYRNALPAAKADFDATAKAAVEAGVDARTHAENVAAKHGVTADASLQTPDVQPDADLDALLAANLPAMDAALAELGIDPSQPPPALAPKGSQTTASPAVQPTAGQPAPAPAVGDFLRQVQQYQLQAQQAQPKADIRADISTDINTPQAAPQQPARMDTEADNGRPAAPPALATGRNTGTGIAGSDRDGQPVLGRPEARPAAADPVAGQTDLAQADGAVEPQIPREALASPEAFADWSMARQRDYIARERQAMRSVIDGTAAPDGRPQRYQTTPEEATERLQQLDRMETESASQFAADNPVMQASFERAKGKVAEKSIESGNLPPAPAPAQTDLTRQERTNATRRSGIPAGLPANPSDDSARLAKFLNDHRARRGLGRDLRFHEVPKAALPDTVARGIAALERATGTKVVLFRNLTPQVEDLNGVTVRDGVLYVNESADKPVTLAAAHEWVHQLRSDAPQLYDQLAAEVRRQGRLPEWSERMRSEGNRTDSDGATEELVADAVADAMTDPAFLERMAERDVGLFRTVARRFLDFLNALLERVDRNSRKYLRDVEAFRETLLSVLEQYDGQTRGREAGDAAFQRNAQKQKGVVSDESVRGDNFKRWARNAPLVTSAAASPKDILFQRREADQTKTPEFLKWFSDSKVVDANGEPLVVYHGTSRSFTEFKVGSAPGWGSGIYFTDNRAQAADEYGGGGGRVVDAYVRIENPWRGNGLPRGIEDTKAWQDISGRWDYVEDAWQEDSGFVGDALRELGYDGVIAESSNDVQGLEIVAFAPEQIRQSEPAFQRKTAADSIESMDKDTTRLYHGGNAGLTEISRDTGPGNIFGGIFASRTRDSAASHGDGSVYVMDVPDDRVLYQRDLDYDIDRDDQIRALRKAMRRLDDADVDLAASAVLDDAADSIDGDELMRVFRSESVGEASWEAQRIRGAVAKDLGYLAVEMQDEHGTSFLVLPGVPVLGEGSVNDPETPDIRFQRKESPAGDGSNKRQQAEAKAEGRRNEAAETLSVARGTAGWDYNRGKWEGRAGQFNRMRRTLQDKMLAWRDAQNQLEAQGAVITDAANVYRLENLMHGRVGSQMDALERNAIEPLMKAITSAGVTPEQLEQYLYARHAEERNQYVASINPKMPDGGSGMTTAEAKKILADADPRMKPLSAMVDRIVKANRKRLLDHGLITQEQFDAMAEQYQNYVPLRGENDAEFENSGTGQGRGMDTRPSPVKRAMGRGTGNLAKNILAEVIGDAQRGIILAEKARVGRAVMRLVLLNPNPALWTVEPVQMERDIDANGEVYERVSRDMSDPSIIAVRHKGQLYAVKIENEPLARALNHVGVDAMHPFFRGLGAVNRYFSAILTRYNPAFVPTNAARDAIFGLTGMAVDHGELAALQAVKEYPAAARAAWKLSRGTLGESQTERYAQEFADAGGKTGMVHMPSIEDLAQKIGNQKLTSFLNPTAYNARGPAAAAKAFGRVVESANDAVENALRLSAYIVLRKRGMSVDAAAEYAKNITVNFNRKGEQGAAMNALFLFFNAAMQGAHRTSKVIRKPKAWAYLGGLAAFQATMTLLAMGMEDDDGENLWDKIPDHIKRRSIVIPTDGDSFVTVPMPYGFNVFTYASGLATEAVTRDREAPEKTGAEIAGNLMAAVAESFIPLPVDAGAAGVIPTIASIPINIQYNKDGLGRSIRSDDAFNQKGMPRYTMAKPDTLEFYKFTAQGLNWISGGDETTPGLIDRAPEDLEYLVSELTGGPGRVIGDSLKLVAKATDPGDEVKLKDIPVLNRFVSGVDEQASQQSLFYDRKAALEREMARVREAFKRDGEKAAGEMLKASPILDGARFRRYKSTQRGHYRGQIIVGDNGMPQFVAVPGSLFDAYKDANAAVSDRNSLRKMAFAEAPASLLPNRERDAKLREADKGRMEAQRKFNAAWLQAVSE